MSDNHTPLDDVRGSIYFRYLSLSPQENDCYSLDLLDGTEAEDIYRRLKVISLFKFILLRTKNYVESNTSLLNANFTKCRLFLDPL